MTRLHFARIAPLFSLTALMFALATDASAQNRLWTPASNNWNLDANWTPANQPDTPPEIANFATAPAALRNPTIMTNDVDILGIRFLPNADSYLITVGPGRSLSLEGFGILNQSGVVQTISNDTGSSTNFFNHSNTGGIDINNDGTGSFTTFHNTSSASSSLIFNNGDVTSIVFFDFSTAGNAGLVNFAMASLVTFADHSTAGRSLISNSGFLSGTFFFNNSNAGGAQIFNTGDSSFVDFSDQSNAGFSFISNDGPNTTVAFSDTASAGASLIFNNADLTTTFFLDSSTAGFAGIVNFGAGTLTVFANDATAGRAVISNSGDGSTTDFLNNSSAGSATIINSGANTSIFFEDQATGGRSRLINANPTASVDISLLTNPSISVGSIAGNGFFNLGSKNLTTGTNGESTVVTGIIQDGGIAGGVGGSLTKVGKGTLILTNANTYTGPTWVNGGELIINGSITSDTFVNGGGLLGGGGTITGNLVNGGIVRPSLPGPLTVTGNYTQTSGGDLRIEIASNTNFGKLNIGGVAKLAGSVTPVLRDNFRPEIGDTFQFLTAAGGVDGKFDKLNDFDSVLDFALRYEANAVILEILQGLFSDIAGLTPNQRAVAKALDRVLFSDKQAKLIDFLNSESLGDIPHDLDLIAPDELAAIFEIGVSLANVQTANLQRRMDDIRSGSNGFSAAGFGMNGQDATTLALAPSDYKGGLSKDDGKSGKTIYQPSPENRWGVFLTGMGEWTDVGGTYNASGFQLTTGGFTLGIDYRVSSNFAIGINAGYAHTGADLAKDGRITADGGKLGLYATYFEGGFYVDTAVNGGYNSYDTRRRALKGTAHGSTDGGEFSGLIGTGYDIKTGGWSFGPTATLQYTVVATEDFKEHGSLAPLNIESQDIESLRSAFGARASYDWHIGDKVVKPEIRAAWQHEFSDREYGIDSRFAGAGRAFRVNGAEFGRDSLLVGAGFAVQWNPRLATYVYYDGNIARDNYSSHNVSGGLRLSF